MQNEKKFNKTIALILAFIPSLGLFWKLIELADKNYKLHIIVQFLFFVTYTALSIFLTNDKSLFDKFWERHSKVKKFFVKVQFISAYVIAIFPFLVGILLSLFAKNSKEEYSQCKKDYDFRVQELNQKSFYTKSAYPFFAISLIVLCILLFFNYSDTTILLIQEILNTIVSFIGFAFVLANAQRSDPSNNNENDSKDS